jgi:hypothetical protein
MLGKIDNPIRQHPTAFTTHGQNRESDGPGGIRACAFRSEWRNRIGIHAQCFSSGLSR